MRAIELARSRFLRFLRDRRGVAAVEFAIILPVMALFYIGTFEVSQAIIVKRKVDNAAETVGGMVARSSDMDSTRLSNILMISDAIIGGVGGDPPVITITTVQTDSKGKALVDWERKGTAQGAANGTSYTLPSDLTSLTDSYFVFATVQYRYAPTFDFGGLFKKLDFKRTFTFRPRKGSAIAWK